MANQSRTRAINQFKKFQKQTVAARMQVTIYGEKRDEGWALIRGDGYSVEILSIHPSREEMIIALRALSH